MTGGALLILLFCAGACYAQDKNVVELAVATPSLSTLVQAVKAADLEAAGVLHQIADRKEAELAHRTTSEKIQQRIFEAQGMEPAELLSENEIKEPKIELNKGLLLRHLNKVKEAK